MIDRARALAKIPDSIPLDALGLCLSGCISPEECNKLSTDFLISHSNLSRSCVAASDTIGSIYTSNTEGECQTKHLDNHKLIECTTTSNLINLIR